ncbi:preprotein translocase subunit SecA [Candidatus Portiera aleyrodidarum]|uniref:Protein translocase subunit SecA n=1 Tax=Candidatus Portiera aleyrodidarum TaxID=91844 RepID=A0A8D9NBB1_9GAMM|nr:preprotein translocase subunit SecA [Candidatus Portiera aleyrodidarum]CEI58825.1 Protein translocase subunit SecA [Candidatus Portiera aleyrodidarum]
MLKSKFIYNKNERELKRISKIVYIINDLETHFNSLNNHSLSYKTIEYRKRIIKGDLLDMLLPEAFSTVREASKRIIGMRHFDVQIIGGIVLHKGMISEMKTGEGKTIVGTLPSYLNALTGLGVHVVTINEYLAKRDSTNIRTLYEFLGLSIKNIYAKQNLKEKINAYKADITYGTNNEYGFDYLRNNMVYKIKEKFQRKLNFALLDEVDSILIDEARTPLIISGQIYEDTKIYYVIKNIAEKLRSSKFTEYEKGDFILDEKHKQVELTEKGYKYIEEIFKLNKIIKKNDSLYSANNIGFIKKIKAALLALYLFKKNVDYIIRNHEVIIVDENTGRVMPGKRWSDGLHQAIEAKEGVNIKEESNTLAYITLQNYFRLYAKIAGMSGTASTELYEFNKNYKLDVLVIPTNKPRIRKDMNDLIFLSTKEKFEAINKDIKEKFYKGQPVVVGTTSIEISEDISYLLKKQKISHKILNAKNHENEAKIIAQAGRSRTITIATKMAGRGTDILLGGNFKNKIYKKIVKNAGGLHVIGTERHESRRIDNQLKGRAGRQGDPGSTRFFISLEDNLMRLFGSNNIKKMIKILGLSYGEAIEHKLINKAVEKAQKKIELRNFDIRKQILEYDKISNYQRKIVYKLRDEILFSYKISEYIEYIRNEVIYKIVYNYKKNKKYNITNLVINIKKILNINIYKWIKKNKYIFSYKNGYIIIINKIKDKYNKIYKSYWKKVDKEKIKILKKQTILQVFDIRWKEHLHMLDYIMSSIPLRGYVQKNPIEEYKKEAFKLFKDLIINIKFDVISVLSKYKI